MPFIIKCLQGFFLKSLLFKKNLLYGFKCFVGFIKKPDYPRDVSLRIYSKIRGQVFLPGLASLNLGYMEIYPLYVLMLSGVSPDFCENQPSNSVSLPEHYYEGSLFRLGFPAMFFWGSPLSNSDNFPRKINDGKTQSTKYVLVGEPTNIASCHTIFIY